MLRRRGRFNVKDNITKTYRLKADNQVRGEAEAARAHQLQNPTLASQAFGDMLRKLGVEFDAECILYRPGGFCLIDFVTRPSGQGFEIDGGYHKNQRRYDAGKEKHAEAQGIKVHRFTNEQVLYHPKETLGRLREILANHPTKEI